MFTAEEIQNRLKTQPFLPVQFVTTTGKMYDVYHPDLVYVTRRYIIIGVLGSESTTIPDQSTHVAIIHITEMRDLPLAITQGTSNGTLP